MDPEALVRARVDMIFTVMGCGEFSKSKGIDENNKDTHFSICIIEGLRRSVFEPVLKLERRFTEIILFEHVLVPHDELKDTKAPSERKVDRKIERCILRHINWIKSLLHDRRLVSVPRE